MLRALILVWMLSVGSASAACRQSLALALDVSASVDAREYVLQLEGVALALEDPAVRAALLDLPDAPVSLAVFEWSGGSYQRCKTHSNNGPQKRLRHSAVVAE